MSFQTHKTLFIVRTQIKIFFMKSETPRLPHQQPHRHAPWYSCEYTSKTDTKEKKLLNKVIIFVFFVHNKYSRSFITLRLYYWCYMDYFNDVLTTFLGLEQVSCIAVYWGCASAIHPYYDAVRFVFDSTQCDSMQIIFLWFRHSKL